MTNREYYGEKILDFFENGGENFGLNKYTNEIVECRELECKNCKFLSYSNCTIMTDWLKEEYKPFVDWSKVPVDTKVLVRNNKDADWRKRYFAKYENGRVYTFTSGCTSWNAEDTSGWNYAKLYDESEE